MRIFLVILIVSGAMFLIILMFVQHQTQTVPSKGSFNVGTKNVDNRSNVVHENVIPGIEISTKDMKESGVKISKEPIGGGNIVKDAPDSKEKIEVKPPEGGWDYER